MQKVTMDSMQAKAEENYQAASFDRQQILSEFTAFKKLLAGVAVRFGIWLGGGLVASLAGCVWYIVTHAHGG